ncbi:integrase, partial [Ewingella americana]
RAMLLALVTGQRLGDIAKMKFTDIWDGNLHITQEKTGARVAIPLALRCSAIDKSLEEIVALCRDKILSPYLLHHHHSMRGVKRGTRIQAQSITKAFSSARDATSLKWSKGTPPTFHEQRSLSERIYRDQGIDTKQLLGHKNQQMTDVYNDDRGRDWTVVAI